MTLAENPNFRLDGKRALVTGASSGIACRIAARARTMRVWSPVPGPVLAIEAEPSNTTIASAMQNGRYRNGGLKQCDRDRRFYRRFAARSSERY